MSTSSTAFSTSLSTTGSDGQLKALQILKTRYEDLKKTRELIGTSVAAYPDDSTTSNEISIRTAVTKDLSKSRFTSFKTVYSNFTNISELVESSDSKDKSGLDISITSDASSKRWRSGTTIDLTKSKLKSFKATYSDVTNVSELVPSSDSKKSGESVTWMAKRKARSSASQHGTWEPHRYNKKQLNAISSLVDQHLVDFTGLKSDKRRAESASTATPSTLTLDDETYTVSATSDVTSQNTDFNPAPPSNNNAYDRTTPRKIVPPTENRKRKVCYFTIAAACVFIVVSIAATSTHQSPDGNDRDEKSENAHASVKIPAYFNRANLQRKDTYRRLEIFRNKQAGKVGEGDVSRTTRSTLPLNRLITPSHKPSMMIAQGRQVTRTSVATTTTTTTTRRVTTTKFDMRSFLGVLKVNLILKIRYHYDNGLVDIDDIDRKYPYSNKYMETINFHKQQIEDLLHSMGFVDIIRTVVRLDQYECGEFIKDVRFNVTLKASSNKHLFKFYNLLNPTVHGDIAFFPCFTRLLSHHYRWMDRRRRRAVYVLSAYTSTTEMPVIAKPSAGEPFQLLPYATLQPHMHACTVRTYADMLDRFPYNCLDRHLLWLCDGPPRPYPLDRDLSLTFDQMFPRTNQL